MTLEQFLTVAIPPAATVAVMIYLIRDLKTDLRDAKTDLKKDIGDAKTDLKKEIGDAKTDLKKEIDDLKADVKSVEETARNTEVDLAHLSGVLAPYELRPAPKLAFKTKQEKAK